MEHKTNGTIVSSIRRPRDHGSEGDDGASCFDMTREPIRFLLFSASLRAGSLNTRLASVARTVIAANGGTVDDGSMSEFDRPSYDHDEEAKAFPPGAEELRPRVEAHDAVRIASPAYKRSTPG